MTISWSASGASGDVTLDSYDAAAHVYLEQSVTHIEMSSIAPSRLGAGALIIPAGLSSNVSTTLSATAARRVRHRCSVSPAPVHSDSVEPNAAGASASATAVVRLRPRTV